MATRPVLPLSVALILCTSCALPGGYLEGPNQINVDAERSTRLNPDAELQKRSEALHSFLSGQLALNEEDFSGAMTYFSRASALVESPAPILHVRLAELYVRSSELEKALEEAEKAVAQDPSDSGTKLLLGGILESLERDDAARKVYSQLTVSDPQLLQPYVLLAGLYFRAELFTEGFATLKKLISVNPSEPIAYYYLGRAYEMRSDLGEAEKYLRQAFERDPENDDVATDLLRVLLKGKRVEDAKRFASKVLEKNPKNSIARRVMSQLMLNENKFDQALEHLEVLETVEDDPTETRFKVAMIHINRQNFKEAIRELNLVLATKPDHDSARYYLASIYAGGGQRKDAVQELYKIQAGQEMFVKSRTFAAFLLRQDGHLDRAAEAVKEALGAEKDNANILAYLVLILRQAEKFAEAESVLADALSEDPKNEKLLLNYGIVLSDLNRESEAIKIMDRVIEVNPKNADALNFIAYSLADRGEDLDRALSLATRALKERVNDGYLLDTLGWIHYRRGEFKKAEEVLSRAASLIVSDIIVLEHYGDVLVKNGKEIKAVEVYRSAITKFDAQDARPVELVAFERVQKKIGDLSKVVPVKPELGNSQSIRP